MRAAYLGPKGTYSWVAAGEMARGAELAEYRSFTAIFQAVADGSADVAVVPVENAIQGSVSQCLDLLYQHSELYIAAERAIPIKHRLAAFAGVRTEDVRRVYSHEQALGQCREFLARELPDARLEAVGSTAEGLALMRERGDACIVGEHAPLPPGCVFLAEEIADRPDNCTVFLELRRGTCPLAPSRKIFFVSGSANKPGALLGILEILRARGLNMTKIESRPLKTQLGEYIFFIEFEGDATGENERAALRELETSTRRFRLLGCY